MSKTLIDLKFKLFSNNPTPSQSSPIPSPFKSSWLGLNTSIQLSNSSHIPSSSMSFKQLASVTKNFELL